MPVIQDLSSNPFGTQTSPMIGFQPLPEVVEDLNLDMYRFIIEGIRSEDQRNGRRFLQRFLQGPQEVWKTTVENILSIKTLWDIQNIRDEYLQYLKNIVGWTSELSDVTDSLDYATLRRLIAASVAFWKTRGPEDSIENILRLTTNSRIRIWNWFDLRIVIDETAYGEDWNGYDPWMVSNSDENEYNIRIVDDGTLDHDLVKALAKLTRPIGERVFITYIGFLDLFKTNNDKSQWTDESDPLALGGAASSSSVSSGVMTLGNGGDWEESYVNVDNSTSWNKYVSTWRIRGRNYRLVFYRTGNGDMYDLLVETSGVVSLRRIIAGVVTVISTFDLTSLLVSLDENVFNAWRIESIPDLTAATSIRVYFESVNIIDTSDPSHAAGTIGFGHADGVGDYAVLDELEMLLLPIVEDTIDLNS